jgi:anti-anti-sigma factor
MGHWDKLTVERIESSEAGVTIYRLSGLLTNTPESYAFLEEFSHRIRKGETKAVLNLEKIEHVTSAGVGILAACYTSLTNAGGKMALALVPLRAHVILNVLKMLDFLGDYPSEEAAVKAVSS